MPKISVAIPVYNAAAYLAECLDSVTGQTEREIEIICVDDGSVDSSRAILAGYAARDPRVKILEHRHTNAGAARNAAIAAATGEYLAFVDADDWCDTTLFEKAYAKAKADDADVVAWRYDQYDMRTAETGSGRVFPQTTLDAPEPFTPEALGDTVFAPIAYAPWCRLVRRAFVARENLSFQELPRTNDVYFCCMVRALAPRQTILDEVLYTYRTGSGTNLQADNAATPETVILAWERVAAELERRGLFGKFRRYFLSAASNSLFYTLDSMGEAKSYAAFFERLRETYGKHPVFSETRPADIANLQTAAYFKMLEENAAPLDFLVAQGNYRRARLSNEYWTRRNLQKSLEAAKRDLLRSQEELQKLKASLRKRGRTIESLENEIDGLKASFAYRLGMFVSWPLRKLRRAFKS